LISAGAGVLGFKTMGVTVPADLLQFFGHVVRVLQKLAYLYGWPELLFNDDDELDDATQNQLTLFVGVMFGVKAATSAVGKIAAAMAQNIPRHLAQQALTKGTIYPIVKRVAAMVGVKMTKKMFASGAGKVIPVVGAAVSGGVTFAMFMPMSLRLKKHLVGLPMASPEHYLQPTPRDIIDIELDFSDINLLEDDIET
jgi:hypothetical protein